MRSLLALPIPCCALACGGEVAPLSQEHEGIPCTADCLTADAAFERARADERFLTDARIVSIRSAADGLLDSRGLSSSWRFLTWSPATQQAHWVAVRGSSGADIVPGDLVLDCGETIPDPPLDSAALVRDADARYAPLDPYEDKTYTARHYGFHLSCAHEATGERSGIRVIRSTREDDPVGFLVEYSWSGAFGRVCGPCPGGNFECDNCPPD